jgi:outer membrane autotransporter protein
MPIPHANLARMLGTDFARSYFISDAILAGFAPNAGVTASPSGTPIESRWHAWATPRQVSFSNRSTGFATSGTLSEITFGLGYRMTPDLMLGLAFTPEQTNVSFQGLSASLSQTGFGGGPYLGWRLRPTTFVDAWVGYLRLDRSFDVFGHGASLTVDRVFVSASLTEVIETPWLRFLPRLTLFHARDEVRTATSAQGFVIPGQGYSWGHIEGSLEINRDITLDSGLLVQPFLRATLRYDTERIVDGLSRFDGSDVEIERWHGQLRGGLRAQFGPQGELWLSAGYLSLFTPDVKAWEAKAHFRLRF